VDFVQTLKNTLPVHTTEHFNIHYYPGSVAEKEADIIGRDREKAFQNILAFFRISSLPFKVDLFLFNDARTKEKVTGHRGAGWAFDTTMVEIYSETTKVNPNHELVHVIADHIYGETASAFSEGLAVYLCNHFNTMRSQDGINGDYRKKVSRYQEQNKLFPLARLFSFNIGTSDSKPFISYPQAASFVAYAIDKLGMEGFLKLYASLDSGNKEGIVRSNIAKIEKAFGRALDDIETDWRGTIMEKAALVTGAAAGIGLLTAKRLIDDGYTVWCVDRSPCPEDLGGIAVQLDLNDDAGIAALCERIVAETGGVDVIVNNAGYGQYGAIETVPMETGRRQMEVNFYAPVRIIQLLLPSMRERGGGRIVNISSVAGKVYSPLSGWYCASKFALEGITDCLRIELKPFNIGVSLIEPSPIRTAWSEGAKSSLLEASEGTAYEEFAQRPTGCSREPRAAARPRGLRPW